MISNLTYRYNIQLPIENILKWSWCYKMIGVFSNKFCLVTKLFILVGIDIGLVLHHNFLCWELLAKITFSACCMNHQKNYVFNVEYNQEVIHIIIRNSLWYFGRECHPRKIVIFINSSQLFNSFLSQFFFFFFLACQFK